MYERALWDLEEERELNLNFPDESIRSESFLKLALQACYLVMEK